MIVHWDTINELNRAREIVGWAYDAAKTNEERISLKQAHDTLGALAVKHGYHDCDDHARPCTTDGPLGHGWECGKCGNFLQAG